VLHHFTNSPDGALPMADLVLSGNTLYGTTVNGGTNGTGTIFCVNTNGTSYQELHAFAKGPVNGTNEDGGYPQATLLLSGNTLYGTARYGGTNGSGTIFSISTNGTNFAVVYQFSSVGGNNNNLDGAWPRGGLAFSGSLLYGTTSIGGTNGNGTVYSLSTNGSNFIPLHNFDTVYGNGGSSGIGNLILSGANLYGTTLTGGYYGGGTVFAMNTNGSSYGVLHNFNDLTDGQEPYGGIILSGGILYGTTLQDGRSGTGPLQDGTLFSLNTNGLPFNVLHIFTETSPDGGTPYCDLAISGSTLYGTAANGGANGGGIVFLLSTNGTGFQTIYNFAAPGTTGASWSPQAGLLLSGNTLYGTAAGGAYGDVFSLQLPAPTLNVAITGANSLVLSWPNTENYTLQQNSNLAQTAGWTASSYPITFANGTNSVTIFPTGGSLLFRLTYP
jgi:uncharacterized repeat protein (TIGR03803 family)